MNRKMRRRAEKLGRTGSKLEAQAKQRAEMERLGYAAADLHHRMGADDGTLIYGSYGARQRSSFALIHDAQNSWQTPHTCFICGQGTIRRSHTIQMSGPIATIAEKGVVMTPEFRPDGSVQMVPCGKAQASTFPGFCPTHEEMFKSFEQRKSIETPADMVLQTFRVVCRELFRLKHEADFFERYLADYTRRKFDTLGKNLAAIATSQMSLGFPDDERENTLKQWIAERRDAYDRIHAGLYAELLKAIETDTPRGAIRGVAADVSYPVCLSGISRIVFKDGATGKMIDSFICFGVFPTANRTAVLVATDMSSQQALAHYMAEFEIATKSGLLEQIEAWMLYHTDHWFIRPSVWRSIPTDRQQRLCQMMAHEHWRVGMRADISILDAVRKGIVAELEGLRNDPGQEKAIEHLLTRERAKLDPKGPLAS